MGTPPAGGKGAKVTAGASVVSVDNEAAQCEVAGGTAGGSAEDAAVAGPSGSQAPEVRGMFSAAFTVHGQSTISAM
jgi:hypothetical protein